MNKLKKWLFRPGGLVARLFMLVSVILLTGSSIGVLPVQSQGLTTGSSSSFVQILEAPAACAYQRNTAYEARVLELLNAERARAGVPALRPQSQLAMAALLHSADMACNNFFSHTGSDGSLFFERIARQGYSGSGYMGENIAAGYTSPESVVAGWMNSPGHRNNILNANYNELGVGYTYWSGSDYGAYWTTDFGQSVLLTISGNVGVGGAVLTYVDGATQTVTADANGNYVLKVPTYWSGTITPSKPNYLFIPSSRSYTNLASNQTSQNYTANVAYSLSGNAGRAGVQLSYSVNGDAKQVATDAGGNYSILVPTGWSGTVTPALEGYTFNPAYRTYSHVTAHQTGQNYVANIIYYAISGNAGSGGVILSYTDGTPQTVTADRGGTYALSVPHGWSGTVTPSKAGYGFLPTARSYTHVTGAITAQDYTAIALPEPFGKISPANSAADLPLSPTLTWSASSGADNYEYCYTFVSSACLAWVSVESGTSTSLENIAPGYTYRWQVRAVNAGGVTLADGGSEWTFTTRETLSASTRWTSAFDLSHGWTVAQYVRTVGDVNGDGRADLVGFGLDGVYVALSSGYGFEPVSRWTDAFDLSHGWTVAQYVRTVGDVNGDGRADLVGFGLDGVYVALSNGHGFEPISKWTSAFDLSHGWTVQDYVRTVGDVDGDGRADLIGFGLDGVYVALSNGHGFEPVSKWTSAFDLSHGWTVQDYVRTAGDVDGDGLADLVGFGLDGVYVATSTASRFTAASRWTPAFDLSHGWTVQEYVRTVGDINGDGLVDLVGFGLDGVYIAIAR